MSARTSFHDPAQKPGRSRVVWIGRCAGEVSSSSSGNRPPPIAGCCLQPEQFLHADRQHRLVALISDRMALAGRRFEMRRRQPAEIALQLVRHQRHQPVRRARRPMMSERPRASRLERHEPVVEPRKQGVIADMSGHGSPIVRCRKPIRSRNCAASFEKGSTPSPSSRTPSASACAAGSPGRSRQAASLRRRWRRAGSPAAPGPAGSAGRRRSGLPCDDSPRQMLPRHRRAKFPPPRECAACAAAAGQVGDDQHLRSRPAARSPAIPRRGRWP